VHRREFVALVSGHGTVASCRVATPRRAGPAIIRLGCHLSGGFVVLAGFDVGCDLVASRLTREAVEELTLVEAQRRCPSGTPKLDAFWRRDPGVLFMALAIFITGVLLREWVLNFFRSDLVHATSLRFAFLLLAIFLSQV
jgi:hypothetical protein